MKTFGFIVAIWIISGFLALGIFAARFEHEHHLVDLSDAREECVVCILAGPVALGVEIGIAIYKPKNGEK